MAMEEKVFFPLAEETLVPEDWAQIDAKVSDSDDPLFGEKVEQRFQELREQILDWDRAT
jgi:hemerythrin-like domain-containing protein